MYLQPRFASRSSFGSLSSLPKTESTGLLANYPVSLDAVTVMPPDINLSVETKREVLAWLVRCWQAANHNPFGALFTNKTFGSAVKLTNGLWTLAGNQEISPETTLCAERNTILRALEDARRKSRPDSEAPKIDWLLLSGPQLGNPKQDPSCYECQTWIQRGRFWDAASKFGTVWIDPQTSQVTLKVQHRLDLLPFSEQRISSLTRKPLHQLPLQWSDKARAQASQISKATVQALLKKAQQKYEDNETVNFSQSNMGVAVLVNGRIFGEAKFDWTKRRAEPTTERAVAAGIQHEKERQARLGGWVAPLLKFLPGTLQHQVIEHLTAPTQVQAIAYYGDALSDLASVRSLGLVAQNTRGTAEALVVTIEHDVIQIRTIDDYMTAIYRSSTGKKFAQK